jgi:pilus assembly protein Flp/PilA
MSKEITQKESAKKEKGASLVEYALLVALIAVLCIVTIRLVGNRVSTNFSSINSNLTVNG